MIALMQEDTRSDRDEGGKNLTIGYFIMKVWCKNKDGLLVFSDWFFSFSFVISFYLFNYEKILKSINARTLIYSIDLLTGEARGHVVWTLSGNEPFVVNTY